MRAIGMLFAVIVAAAPAAASDTPSDAVYRLHAGLEQLSAAGQTLDYERRYEMLAPIIEQTHDLGAIARLSLGPRWGELDETQQNAYVDAFRRLSIGTYASRFDGPVKVEFSIDGEQAQPRGMFAVRGSLKKADGEEVSFDYLLRHGADGWRIINIIANGVSDLALKRAEYVRVLDDEGFAVLMDRLEMQIDNHATGG